MCKGCLAKSGAPAGAQSRVSIIALVAEKNLDYHMTLHLDDVFGKDVLPSPVRKTSCL